MTEQSRKKERKMPHECTDGDFVRSTKHKHSRKFMENSGRFLGAQVLVVSILRAGWGLRTDGRLHSRVLAFLGWKQCMFFAIHLRGVVGPRLTSVYGEENKMECKR